MREHPILFSGPMVRVLLDGQKTQTRRIVKPQPDIAQAGPIPGMGICAVHTPNDQRLGRLGKVIPCPYGQPGDRLWVREAWADDAEAQWEPEKRGTFYRADDDAEEIKADCDAAGIPFQWRPSIHMHRWRSRITLEIISVRVGRLNDISETDATAEGVTLEDHHKHGYCSGEFLPPPVRAFRDLWESINGAGSWTANPWVWVVEFRRVDHD